jgi:hypothetical protein
VPASETTSTRNPAQEGKEVPAEPGAESSVAVEEVSTEAMFPIVGIGASAGGLAARQPCAGQPLMNTNGHEELKNFRVSGVGGRVWVRGASRALSGCLGR